MKNCFIVQFNIIHLIVDMQITIDYITLNELVTLHDKV